MSKWYESSDCSMTVSSRVRIARNIEGYAFPKKLSDAHRKELCKKITDAVMLESAFSSDLKVIDMTKLTKEEKISMVERHIISIEFAMDKGHRELILSEDESISIMLCEEDHIRIQVLRSGLCFDDVYETANRIDTLICEKLPVAFDENLGFLTECPTNLGTGLRASVMLHLPLLENAGEISGVADMVSKIGLTVRGMYGEGSRSKGSFYQLSNQVTLGISEKDALKNLESITKQIVAKEEALAEKVDVLNLEDTVCRAYGTLCCARLMNSAEMMQDISMVMLGIRAGILSEVSASVPLNLFITTQPSMLEAKDENMTSRERDKIRADIIRNAFSS